MKILRGTIFGGIVYFLLGWLVWGILLMDFFSANMNQCANRPGNEMVWWAIILSNLLMALLLTLIMHWARAKTIVDGLKYGAIFGLLYGSAIAVSYWSTTTMYLRAGAVVVDIIVSTVVMAIIGLVIVLTRGKEK
ncbi:MAG: hypothetical protein WAV93_00015 [Bacteroidales bacterium]